jgi:L-threonylcarbamoyladenylate synthase
MQTEIIKIDSTNIEVAKIKQAADIIRNGGLVAFPTETVYGLGADALNPVAVAKIFEAKNRPLNDPLIMHIADREDLLRLSNEVYKITLDLVDEFWPGPLTLVLKKSQDIPPIVTAGLETVAVRMPDHPVALSLIRESQTPIAAPSANLFRRPSPTSAQHVLDDLNEKVDLILDAGKTNVGVESTILDLTQTPFRILRPGGVSLESLRTIIPDIEPYNGNKILAPGMFIRHYSPKAKVILVEENGKVQIDKINLLASEFAIQGYCIGIIAKEENKDKYSDFNVKVFGPTKNLNLCAANLFSILREFDKEGAQVIIAESVKEEGLGVAIMDRLRKASGRENKV